MINPYSYYGYKGFIVDNYCLNSTSGNAILKILMSLDLSNQKGAMILIQPDNFTNSNMGLFIFNSMILPYEITRHSYIVIQPEV